MKKIRKRLRLNEISSEINKQDQLQIIGGSASYGCSCVSGSDCNSSATKLVNKSISKMQSNN